MDKPREYRNNNASETIDVSKVRNARRGFYVTVQGNSAFLDTTNTTEYGLKLKLEEVEGSSNRHPITTVRILHGDGSVSDVGYIMDLHKTRPEQLRDEKERWVFHYTRELEGFGPTNRHVIAPSLAALFKYLQARMFFTSAIMVK